MFDFVQDWQAQIAAARPHIENGIRRADIYACQVVDLLRDIRDRGRIETFQKVATYTDLTGAGEVIEVPNGQTWHLMAVTAIGNAGDVVIRQGGILRYAEELTVTETVSINPPIIVGPGSQLAITTELAVEIAVVFNVEYHEATATTREGGEQRPVGYGGQFSEPELSRHATDEATSIGTPDDEAIYRERLDEPTDDKVVGLSVPYPEYEG